MKNLEIKIFSLCVLLQEMLDETQGHTKFKHKVRYHVNSLQKELDKILDVEFEEDGISLLISHATKSLEYVFDTMIEEEEEDK